MKTVNAAKNQESTATYFVTNYGDIRETADDIIEDCEVIVGKVIVDSLYIGSADQMRQAALRKYLAA